MFFVRKRRQMITLVKNADRRWFEQDIGDEEDALNISLQNLQQAVVLLNRDCKYSIHVLYKCRFNRWKYV